MIILKSYYYLLDDLSMYSVIVPNISYYQCQAINTLLLHAFAENCFKANISVTACSMRFKRVFHKKVTKTESFIQKTFIIFNNQTSIFADLLWRFMEYLYKPSGRLLLPSSVIFTKQKSNLTVST